MNERYAEVPSTVQSEAVAAPEWPAGDPWVPERYHGPARLFVALFWMIPVAFYYTTACRGVGWVDCANHVADVYKLGLGSWVNCHNLFFVLGRLWLFVLPLQSPAFALNLFASLCGAVTVTMVLRVGLALTNDLAASTLGAIGLMWSHSLWWHSTIVEVYSLNTAILATMVWLVVRWTVSRELQYLYGAVFCVGLGISNHVLMGLFVPAFLVLFALPGERSLRRWSVFLTGLAALVLGAQLWLTQFGVEFVASLNVDTPWGEQSGSHVLQVAFDTLRRATGGRFQEAMFPDDIPLASAWRWRLKYVELLALQYPSVLLPAGFYGFWRLWRDPTRRTFAVFLTAAIGLQALWSANYFVWDMFAFGLPVWTLFAIGAIIGLDAAFRAGGTRSRRALALSPTILIAPVLYLTAAAQTHDGGRLNGVFTGLGKNLYDAGEFLVNPNKRNFTQTEDVIAGLAQVLPPGARLWDSESKGFFPFHRYYQKVLGGRPDVINHQIFGPFLTEEVAADHAKKLRAELESGQRVFITSVLAPERLVLSQLYRDLAGEAAPPVRALLRLTPDEFIRGFPRYEFQQVDLPHTDGAYIFEIIPRLGAGETVR